MFKKSFKLSITRDTFQNRYNVSYPEVIEIKAFADLKDAVRFDHVGAIYKDNRRSVANFLSADCIVMDVDNNGTEDKNAWIAPVTLQKIFPDVEYYVIYSRHDDKEKIIEGKDGKGEKRYSPRPRFHIYFPLSEAVNDAEQLTRLKEALLEICPAFDKSAADAARFIFGVEEPKGLPFYGSTYVDNFIAQQQQKPEVIIPEIVDDKEFSGVIHAGTRNSKLYNIAINALSRYSEEEARKIFDEACERCLPQLPNNEIKTIWNSAQKSRKVQKSNENKKEKKICSNDIGRLIKSLGIKARFNIITGKPEITDLPLNSPFISEDFKNLTPAEQIELAPREFKNLIVSYLWHENYSINLEFLNDILSAYINYHPFNPVLEMLEGVKWDGHDRIYELGRILNITDNAHYMLMLRKWLIQAIAILHNDGNNSLDFVLTLQGRQGLGKTEFFRIIAMRQDWFRSGIVVDMANKDSRIEAVSCWIGEFGELDSTLKKEQTSLKAFITQTKDRYRRPYATDFIDRPRRTCFAATVNDEKFLRDTTGNRRWAVIHVDTIDLNTLHSLQTNWLMQLWRQVYELYLNGDTFRLTPEEREINELQNKNALVYLPCEQEILEGLNWEHFPNMWAYRTASSLREEIPALKNADVRRIGKALTKLAEEDERIKVIFKHGGVKLYNLPAKAQKSY